MSIEILSARRNLQIHINGEAVRLPYVLSSSNPEQEDQVILTIYNLTTHRFVGSESTIIYSSQGRGGQVNGEWIGPTCPQDRKNFRQIDFKGT